MNNMVELIDALNQHDDSKVVRYKYLTTLIRIIYLCLKYRYCYQIGMTQKNIWYTEVEIISYHYRFSLYKTCDTEKDIEFFNEGESLKNIFNEVVHFMTCYQGYHDIPEDLYKEFTRDKICIYNEKGEPHCLLKESWFCKYARGPIIKRHLDMIKWNSSR